jgi:hypothetical protein
MAIHGLIAVCDICGAEDGPPPDKLNRGFNRPMPELVRNYLTPKRWTFDDSGRAYCPNCAQ